jgi:hypothetical protein
MNKVLVVLICILLCLVSVTISAYLLTTYLPPALSISMNFVFGLFVGYCGMNFYFKLIEKKF